MADQGGGSGGVAAQQAADESTGGRPAPSRPFRGGPLSELAARPGLTTEQEHALGWRIRGVDVRVPAPGDPRPSPQAARNRLIEQNVRLVIAIAKQYSSRGVPTDDLIQEGLLSLHRAAEKFDPGRGFRFGTYATWWVRHAMSRACVESAPPVRLPEDLASRARQAMVEVESLRARLGRQPSTEETAAAVELRADQLLDAWSALRPAASLDAPDPSGQALSETLLDPGPTPEQEVLERSERAELRRLIDELPRREREVLQLQLGLDPPRSSLAVRHATGASRQRIYALGIKALRRLHQMQVARPTRAPAAPTERPVWAEEESWPRPVPLRPRPLSSPREELAPRPLRPARLSAAGA